MKFAQAMIALAAATALPAAPGESQVATDQAKYDSASATVNMSERPGHQAIPSQAMHKTASI